jgi:hypothetical protein
MAHTSAPRRVSSASIAPTLFELNLRLFSFITSLTRLAVSKGPHVNK